MQLLGEGAPSDHSFSSHGLVQLTKRFHAAGGPCVWCQWHCIVTTLDFETKFKKVRMGWAGCTTNGWFPTIRLLLHLEVLALRP